MQWFRMWVDAIDDEKLKLLAFEDRWHYVAILCMKRKGILDVTESAALTDRKVGVKLGLGDRERDEARRRLIDVDLIDENWQPKGWTKRQFISDADPTATQRKQKQRDRQRHAPVTRDSRVSHTAQSQITDTESEKKTPTESRVTKRDTAQCKQVFEHWQRTWNRMGTKLDVKRSKRIEARLNDGFTAEQLCDAISGFRNSPWHCGTDPKGGGKVYDAIDTLLRDTAQVEEGMRLLARPPRPPPKPENATDRILRGLSDDDSRVIEHEPERTATRAISRQ